MSKRNLYPLTHAQTRILHTDMVYPDSSISNLNGVLIFKGENNVSRLQETVNALIKNNDVLRARICNHEGEFKQYFVDYKETEFDVNDFTQNNEVSVDEWIEYQNRIPFTIEDSCLYYFVILKISDEEMWLYSKWHHLVSDGISLNLMGMQMLNYYFDRDIQAVDNLSYKDHIMSEKQYMASTRFEKDKKYWIDEFEALPKMLLSNSGNFTNQYSSSLEAKRKVFTLPSHLVKQIRQHCQDYKTNPFTLYMTVLYLCLSKMSDETDLVLGTAFANRTKKQEKNMIGMFVSTTPIRMKLNPEFSFLSTVKSVAKKNMEALRHQKYPYNVLLEDLRKQKMDVGRLFNIFMDYRPIKWEKIEGATYEQKWLFNGQELSDLAFHIEEQQDNDFIEIAIDYKIDIYTSEDIGIFFTYYQNLLQDAMDEPTKKLSDLQIVSNEERHQLLVGFNDTHAAYPKHQTIHQLFEEQVEKTPDAIAVIFEGQNITYRTLNQRANQLARVIREKGIQADGLVGIIVEPSLEMIVGILAILKAGGAYVPIDPGYPAERIEYMVADSGVKLLLTQHGLTEQVESYSGEVLYLDVEEIYQGKVENLAPISSSDSLAYIIYTSGTTGMPKGVMIEHRNVVRLLFNDKTPFDFNETDVWTMFHSFCFDFSVWEMYGALLYGGKLVVISKDTARNPVAYLSILEKEKVTILNQTPTAFYQLIEEDLKSEERDLSIRKVIFGGEALAPRLIGKWKEKYPEVATINMYGITETTVHVTYKEITEKDIEINSRTIGKPIPTLSVYLLDTGGKLAPIGVPGEMYVSGAGVARGYLNNPDLSAERFLENPFVEGERMYKTGDLGRWLPDGTIEYLGRSDDQVKIRGYRIELSEVELHLTQIDSIQMAVVVAYEADNNGKSLCAYFVASEELTISYLRQELVEKLPNYMIPSYFVQLDKIPLTSNGKVNKKALPAPKQQSIVMNKVNDSETLDNNEEVLISAIKEVFQLEKVSIHDNFFEIGGDSIKAIQITSKLMSENVELTVVDILKLDTLREIAKKMKFNDKKKSNREICSGTIGKTPIINWFFSLEDDNKNHWNQSALIKLKVSLTTSQINTIMGELIRHHDMLRANYNRDKDQLFYNNSHLNNKNFVEEYDLFNLNDQEQRKRILEIGRDMKSGFNIENSLLFKASIINLGDDNKLILFVAHHLVIDGLSWRIILEDFSKMALLIQEDKPLILPSKSKSFQSWATSLLEYKETINHDVREYWSNVEPSNKNFNVVTYHDISTVDLTIDNSKLHLLRKLQDDYKMNLNELLIFLFVYSLKDMNKNQFVSMDIETHGRDLNIDVSSTVGWFTNLFPITFYLKNRNLTDSLKNFKEVFRGVPNNGLDYGLLSNSFHGFKENLRADFRYNYLGDFDNTSNSVFSFLDIDTGEDVALANNFYYLIDIVGMKQNNEIKFFLSFSEKNISYYNVMNLTETFHGNLDYLLNNYDSDKIIYSKSDFKEVSLSQEELEIIFDS